VVFLLVDLVAVLEVLYQWVAVLVVWLHMVVVLLLVDLLVFHHLVLLHRLVLVHRLAPDLVRHHHLEVDFQQIVQLLALLLV